MHLGPGFSKAMLILTLAWLNACGGGGTSAPAPVAPPTFALAVSPGSLQIPAGGSGFVVVTISRLNGFRGDIALAGIGFPTGAAASGLVPDGAASLQLSIALNGTVAQSTFANLRIEGRSGNLVQTAPFSLTVRAPLPPAQLSVDVAQAPGGRQQGGAVENTVVVQEPLRALPAASASGTVQMRHGFLPSGSPLNP